MRIVPIATPTEPVSEILIVRVPFRWGLRMNWTFKSSGRVYA